MEYMVHDTVALRACQQFITEANQAARGNNKFHAQITGNLAHIDEFGFTGAQFFHNRAHKVLRHIYC